MQLHSLLIILLPAKEGAVAALAAGFHFYLRTSLDDLDDELMTDGAQEEAAADDLQVDCDTSARFRWVPVEEVRAEAD